MASGTILASLAESELNMHFREAYTSEGLNQKTLGVVPRGLYRGFQLSTNITPLFVTVVADPTWNDHVAAYESYETASGFNITVQRIGGNFSLNLTALSGLTVYIALYVSYAVTATSAGSIRAYTQAQYDAAAEKPYLVILGTVVVPGSAIVIPAGNISTGAQTLPWQTNVASVVPWTQIVRNNSFEDGQVGALTAGSNYNLPFWTDSTGANIAQVSLINTDAANGTKSISATRAAPVTWSLIQNSSITCIPLTGIKIQINFKRMQIITGGSLTVDLTYVTDAGAVISTISSTIFTSGGTDTTWQYLEVSQAAPVTSSRISKIAVSANALNGAVVGELIRIDSVLVLVQQINFHNTDPELDSFSDLRGNKLLLSPTSPAVLTALELSTDNSDLALRKVGPGGTADTSVSFHTGSDSAQIKHDSTADTLRFLINGLLELLLSNSALSLETNDLNRIGNAAFEAGTSHTVTQAGGNLAINVAGNASLNASGTGTAKLTTTGSGNASVESAQAASILAANGPVTITAANGAVAVSATSGNITLTVATSGNISGTAPGSVSLTGGTSAIITSNGAGPASLENGSTGEVHLTTSAGNIVATSGGAIHLRSSSADIRTQGVVRGFGTFSDPLRFGRRSASVAGLGTYTLTTTDYDSQVIELTGALTGEKTIVFPTADNYAKLVYNNTTGEYPLYVKTVAGTNNVRVLRGQRTWVYCNGTDMLEGDISSRIIRPDSNTRYWFPCNEASGTNINNYGADTGITALTTAGGISRTGKRGIFGNAYWMSSNDTGSGYAQGGDNQNMGAPASNVSLSCWYRPSDFIASYNIFGYYNTGESSSILSINMNTDGNIYTAIRTSAVFTFVGFYNPTPVALGSWNLLSLTYDGSTLTSIVNGISQHSNGTFGAGVTGSIDWTTGTGKKWRLGYSGSQGAPGLICDARAENTLRSEAFYAEMYRRGFGYEGL